MLRGSAAALLGLAAAAAAVCSAAPTPPFSDAVSLLQAAVAQSSSEQLGGQRLQESDEAANLAAAVGRQSASRPRSHRDAASKEPTASANEDPLADVPSSRRLHKLLLEGIPRQANPMPWFYSQRMDGSRLGKVAESRSRLVDMSKRFSQESSEMAKKLARDGEHWDVGPTDVDMQDFGRIFILEADDDDPQWLHVRTIFNKYVAMNPDGHVTADRDTPSGDGAKFRFVPHPYEKDAFCMQLYDGQCLSDGFISGVPALVAKPPENGTGVTSMLIWPFPDRESQKAVLSFSSSHALAASMDVKALNEWFAKSSKESPYEYSRLLVSKAREFEGSGHKLGAITGMIIGGFFVLLAHNLHFAITSKAPAPKARMPNFDMIRFVLETLVIHAHIGLIGLLPSPSPAMFMSSFRMPAFMIISGVFGSNLAYESVSKLLCCTFGTLVLMIWVRMLEYRLIYGDEYVASHLGKGFHLDVAAPGLWFLVTLAVYRLLVSPLFYVARSRKLSPFFALAFVKVVSYFLMHWIGNSDAWILSKYIWGNILAFAPFFAVGLCGTPKEWDDLFKRRWFQAVGIAYFTAWYLLILNGPFLEWNHSYCIPSFQPHGGCFAHFDPEQVSGPVNIQTFLLDIVMFGLRIGIALSFCGIVVLVCEIAGRILPQIIELMAGWGSRTLYAYVIHLHCISILQEDALLSFSRKYSKGTLTIIDAIVPLAINITLSSQGSELWFKWLLMPFWIKDILEKVCASCKLATYRLMGLPAPAAEAVSESKAPEKEKAIAPEAKAP